MATYGSGIRTIETGTADQAMQRVREAGGNWGYLDPESVDAAIRAGGAKSEDAINALENLKVNVVTLQSGQAAYGNITGTVPNLTFNLGVPRGRDGIGANEAAALVAEAQQARNASIAAQVAAEQAKAAAFAEPDTVVAQMITDAATQTHVTLAGQFQRRDELSGLLAWRIAYEQRDTAKARVVVLGSNEGQGATEVTNRWTERLQTHLRDGATGGRWLSASSSAEGINSGGLFLTGTTERAGETNGFGGRTLLMRGGAEAATPIMVMTGATVWFQRNNFFTSGGEVLVDGTKVADIPSVGDFAPAQSVTITTTNTAHVVTVRATGGADQALELVAIHVHAGDETTGVEVIEGSRRGAWLRSITAGEWDSSHNPVIAALDPSLVLIYAGDQDWLDDATGFFEGAVAGIPAKIDSLVERNHSVLLVLPPRPVPSVDRDPARYAYIRSMMASAAAAYPTRVAFFDAGEHFPRLEEGGATSQGLFVETARPRTLSDAGHAWLARVMADLLR
ncbi:MAG TPA: hypothetical protein VK053_09575 [Jiangellaceae bacterium]|nr:hypothetical protein [Jiangellaceae bacterium]